MTNTSYTVLGLQLGIDEEFPALNPDSDRDSSDQGARSAPDQRSGPAFRSVSIICSQAQNASPPRHALSTPIVSVLV